MDEQQLLAELRGLRTAKLGGRTASHKPLLLLWLLKRFVEEREWKTTYDEAEGPVGTLIRKYAPGAGSASDVAAAPFVRLERSLWDLSDSAGAAIASSSARSGGWLKAHGAQGALNAEFVRLLHAPDILVAAIETLLTNYFEADVVEEVRAELRLDLSFLSASSALRRTTPTVTRRVKTPPAESTVPEQIRSLPGDEDLDFDTRLRWQAFAWLEELSKTHQNRIPSSQLGLFNFEGHRIALADQQQGIRKPKELKAALSIKTVYRRPSEKRPYEDEESSDGLIRYKYRGTDPGHSANVALRRAFEEKRPLIWFVGVESGVYEARFPLWIVADDPTNLQVVASFDPPGGIDPIWRPLVRRRQSGLG
ncbi:hypothetical protein [Amycolatopsis sp. cmx-4-68]|uniref:hypothetical protein n=1 Tax=Amycolatopsis sp. cmx-4-68 TaxID=2790938 RepID=UPI00397E2C14